MINTISPTKFDSPGNQGNSFVDGVDTDPYSDLFAALFIVPVISPPTLMPSQDPAVVSSSTSSSTELSAPFFETNRMPISVANSTDLRDLLFEAEDKRIPVADSTDLSALLSETNVMPIPAAGSTGLSALLSHTDVAPIPDGGTIDLSELLSETDPVPMPEFTQTNSVVPSPDLLPLQEQIPDIDLPPARLSERDQMVPSISLNVIDAPDQEILELGAQIPGIPLVPDTGTLNTPSVLPEVAKADSIKVPIGPLPPVLRKPPPTILPFIDAKDVSEVSYSQDLPTEFSKPTTEPPAINYFAPNIFPIPEPKGLPTVFKDVSSVVKADNSLRTTFQDDALPDLTIVEHIKQSFANDSSQTFDQSRSELPRNVRELDGPDTASGLSFDTTLRAAVRDRKIFDPVPTESKTSERVFDQVEPRLLELVSINHNSSEKRVLKMRLTPADLGTVEITVEKNAAGKINAHFQTQSQATREILNESLIQLRDSLEKSGMQVGDLEISCTTFSSNGNEGRGERKQEFGTADDQPVGTTNFDGIPQDDENKQDRLVNLRA